MCYSALPPHTPFAESTASSSSQPLASLSSHPPPDTVTHEGSVRKRVVRACEVCRRKKVKCNGQKPCDQCIAYAEECSYVDVKDRSAYSRRYVESLEARILELERRVDHLYTMPPGGQSLGGGGMRRASDPGYSSMNSWAGQNERVHRTSQLRLTPMDDAVEDDLKSLSAMSLATAGVGTTSGVGQQQVSSQCFQGSGEQLSGASHKRLRASTVPQAFDTTGPEYPSPRPETSPELQARLSMQRYSSTHQVPITSTLAPGANNAAQAAEASIQWTPQGSSSGGQVLPHVGQSLGAGIAFDPQHQQQQHQHQHQQQQQHQQYDRPAHGQNVTPQALQQPFVVNQQNLMAGFLNQFIQQDQHTRRQAP